MRVSVETPVFKGGWLRECVGSVLNQTCPDWTLSLLWDGGDEPSRRYLEELQSLNYPNIKIYFEENQGIAGARRFLSSRSEGEYILPLDDDDVLAPDAVERFLGFVRARPWCGIARARRSFIDERGRPVDEAPWFPFERRHYRQGMVTDLQNHCQPYLIARSAYERTAGWEGFADYRNAGEDCDIFLKIEEVASIELLDANLYFYRLNSNRTSLVLTASGAYEMWRRLADRTIARIGLPLERDSEKPPFHYRRLPEARPTMDMVDVVISGALADGVRERTHQAQASLLGYGVSATAIHVSPDDRDRLPERNALLRRTSRPFLLLLDADVEVPEPDVLDRLLAVMHAQSADLAGPRVVSPRGTVLCAEPYFDARGLPTSKAFGEPDEGQCRYVAEAAWLQARALLIRREVLNAAGYFDEQYATADLAQVDLCLKARSRDFKCMYVGTVSIVDHGSDGIWSRTVTDLGFARLREKWKDYPDLFVSGSRLDLIFTS
jgi:GT2 family glycosyltransferase